MNFLNDFFINSPVGIFIVISAFIGIIGAFAVQRYITFRNASGEFRRAFAGVMSDISNPTRTKSVRDIVVRDFSVHSEAVAIFREHLRYSRKTRFDKAWVLIYATEADLLNTALFGKTAKEWRNENKGKKGNIREYATVEQLVVLASLESQNALLIEQGIEQSERIIMLNQLARNQIKSLINNPTINKLKV